MKKPKIIIAFSCFYVMIVVCALMRDGYFLRVSFLKSEREQKLFIRGIRTISGVSHIKIIF